MKKELIKEKLDALIKEKEFVKQQGVEETWQASFQENLSQLLAIQEIALLFTYLGFLAENVQNDFLNQQIIPFAVQRLQQNEGLTILPLLESSLLLFSKNSELLHLYGITVSICQNNSDKAIRLIKKAIHLFPFSSNYFNNLANIYLAKSDYKNASNCFNQLLNLEPNNQTILNKLDVLKKKTPLIKKINVAYYSLDNQMFAVARLRVIDPFLYMSDKFNLLYGVRIQDGKSEIRLDILEKADLIIIQRGFPCAATQKLIEVIFKSGKPVVYETDDLLTEIPEHHNKPHYRQNAPLIENTIKEASFVTVSTQFLRQQYLALNSNIKVLPNLLNDELWNWDKNPIPNKQKLTIGFYGSKGHLLDLTMIENALLAIYEQYGTAVHFSFIGYTTEKLKSLTTTNFKDANFNYHSWSTQLKNCQIDIGVVPLLDEKFNQARSLIKWLEYSALSIPVIFSNTAEYRDKVNHLKTGILVNNTQESWYTALVDLIENEEVRNNIANNAKNEVKSHYMLSNQVKKTFFPFYKGLV